MIRVEGTYRVPESMFDDGNYNESGNAYIDFLANNAPKGFTIKSVFAFGSVIYVDYYINWWRPSNWNLIIGYLFHRNEKFVFSVSSGDDETAN